MDIACIKCSVEYRIEKNEIVVIEMADFGPYRVWFADLWKCPKCNNLIISGYGENPIAEHYAKDFPEKVKNLMEHYQTFFINER